METIRIMEDNAMKCNSLEEVRKNIDRIDDAIIKLIAKVREKAKEYGAEPDMVEAIYREMISRFVDMEMSEFHNNTL